MKLDYQVCCEKGVVSITLRIAQGGSTGVKINSKPAVPNGEGEDEEGSLGSSFDDETGTGGGDDVRGGGPPGGGDQVVVFGPVVIPMSCFIDPNTGGGGGDDVRGGSSGSL